MNLRCERRAVLVTGGAGYIGAHACKALSESGYLPICFDNLSTGHSSFAQWGPLIVADIRDTTKLVEVLQSYRVCAVMHFAAVALVGESVVDPQKYYLNNVVGSISLFNAMRLVDCRKLVFSSTCAVYGNASSARLVESSSCSPVNPYGASKLMTEQILEDYKRAYNFDVFCLRYFNAGGADLSGCLGEVRDVETHLIPRAMMALQGYVKDFSVFGEDYETPDGTAIRDYIHVADLASAHVLALNRLLEGDRGKKLNLGTGAGISVKEILAAIFKEVGHHVPYQVRGRREGDPAYLVANVEAAKKELNFEPRFSDISTIIRTAWAWHQRAHPQR